MTEPARTVFFGSGGFAVPILEALVGAPETEVVGVVTAPDRPAGRSGELSATPVARRCRDLGLPTVQPIRVRDPDTVAVLAELRPELGVLADYGRIIPPAILDLPRQGILNVHPSLLPRWRGASPVPAAILAGDRETGVTLMSMDAGLDTGPIVGAERWTLIGDETAPELEARAAGAGAGLLARLVGPWLRGEIAAVAQDEAAATLTRPLRREDGRLGPHLTAAELERHVRAFEPWPGSFVEVGPLRIAVLRAMVAEGLPGDVAGSLVAHGAGLALAAAGGRLVLLDVQPAGGRRMSSAELRRGRPQLAGRSVR